MNIGFIGAGKVGKSFGIYLNKKGIKVVGYYSRSKASAEAGAHLTNSMAYENPKDLIQACELIIITTPDDVIENVCKFFSENYGFKKNQMVAHMSGASNSDILLSSKKQNTYTYSIHPLQAFANVNKAVQDLENTPFGIEGDDEKLEKIKNLLEKCGNKYFTIDKDNKILYHAAACIVSNYLVTLMNIGTTLLKTIGIDEENGFNALLPLIQSSLKNIKNLGPSKALTGPIVRADINTIHHHLQEIERQVPEFKNIYQYLGQETIKLAELEKLKDTKSIELLYQLMKRGTK